MQEPASISKWSLPIAIAPMGQVASQAPQLRQSLLITYAMEHTSSHDISFYHLFSKLQCYFLVIVGIFLLFRKKLRKIFTEHQNMNENLYPPAADGSITPQLEGAARSGSHPERISKSSSTPKKGGTTHE